MDSRNDKKYKNWVLEEAGYDPSTSGHYETLFTLSNGYIGIRGVKDCSEGFYRKGTFLAGVFDKAQAQVTEIVNCPGFFNFDLYVENEKVDLDKVKVISYKRILNMRSAILTTCMDIECQKGKRLVIEIDKMVSMVNKNLCAFSVNIKSVNFSGKIALVSFIDGSITNIDSQNSQKVSHYSVTDRTVIDPETVMLKARTIDDAVEMCFVSRLSGNENNSMTIEATVEDNKVCQTATFYAEQDKLYTVNKLIFAQSKSDEGIIPTNPIDSCFREHMIEMHRKWALCDIEIVGDDRAQVAVRYNIFSLLMLGANLDGNTNLGAKGLHGEGYKGHVFWDTEIFMLPFYIYNDPEAAKKLLMYRYNRLQAAKENAAAEGFDGAKFPWESAGSGREVTPKIIYLPPDELATRCWTGDEEIHVNGDVAFAFHEYYRITGDKEFYFHYCAEVIFETAKYWESKLEYNQETGKYDINSVIGPDEFHIHVNNNFYTNYMAKWNIRMAAETWEELKIVYPQMFESIKVKVNLTDERIKLWREKVEKIALPPMNGVVEQFDGFFKLKDYEIVEHKPDGMPILPSCFRTELDFEEYQLIKQPDVVMIMHLFNHEFSHNQKLLNYEYYEKRTTHISSLSPSIYCLMGIDIKSTGMAYKYFDIAANTDIDDNQGNTKHGIHAASLGGTWQAVVFGFGGFRIKDKKIHLNPWLPEGWEALSYRVCWQGNIVYVKVSMAEISIRIQSSNNDDAFIVNINGVNYGVKPNLETQIKNI